MAVRAATIDALRPLQPGGGGSSSPRSPQTPTRAPTRTRRGGHLAPFTFSPDATLSPAGDVLLTEKQRQRMSSGLSAEATGLAASLPSLTRRRLDLDDLVDDGSAASSGGGDGAVASASRSSRSLSTASERFSGLVSCRNVTIFRSFTTNFLQEQSPQVKDFALLIFWLQRLANLTAFSDSDEELILEEFEIYWQEKVKTGAGEIWQVIGKSRLLESAATKRRRKLHYIFWYVLRELNQILVRISDTPEAFMHFATTFDYIMHGANWVHASDPQATLAARFSEPLAATDFQARSKVLFAYVKEFNQEFAEFMRRVTRRFFANIGAENIDDCQGIYAAVFESILQVSNCGFAEQKRAGAERERGARSAAARETTQERLRAEEEKARADLERARADAAEGEIVRERGKRAATAAALVAVRRQLDARERAAGDEDLALAADVEVGAGLDETTEQLRTQLTATQQENIALKKSKAITKERINTIGDICWFGSLMAAAISNITLVLPLYCVMAAIGVNNKRNTIAATLWRWRKVPGPVDSVRSLFKFS